MAFSSQTKAGGLAVALESVGYLHGYTGSKTPENITQSSSPMSATLWWRKNKICRPGSKHTTCRLCPDFASNQTAKKEGSLASCSLVHVIMSFVGSNFFTCVHVKAVLSGKVWFAFSFASAFSYPAYWLIFVGICGFGIIDIPVISNIRLMILLHRLVVC